MVMDLVLVPRETHAPPPSRPGLQGHFGDNYTPFCFYDEDSIGVGMVEGEHECVIHLRY